MMELATSAGARPGIFYKCLLNSARQFSVFIFWILLTKVTYQTLAECPSNPQRTAFSCFAEYNTQLLNMQKSRGTLFSGVDVEILRAFCSSYILAMSCISNLKSSCPKSEHRRIDVTLYNLEGARTELSELCHDDKLYEVYARHMSCFQSAGPFSEQCFEDIMNTTIRLMKRINDKGLAQLCSDLQLTLMCIRSNIQQSCGQEAASLVNVLVKPMVRRSTKCDDFVSLLPPIQSWTTPQVTTQHYMQSDESHHVIDARTNKKHRQKNGGSMACLTILHWLIVSSIFLLT